MPSTWAAPRGSLAPAWWTGGFVVLTTIGLGLLTWGLLAMHAVTYGAFEVMRPQSEVIAPDFDKYARALLVGVALNVLIPFGLVWLASKSRPRNWHPLGVAGIAASAGALVASSASLLMLGISPVEFLLAL